MTEIAEEYYNLGNAHFELEQYDRSYEYYLRAQELDPDITASSYNLARLEIERGRLEVALDLLDELLLQDPENLLILETSAYAQNLRGRRSEAVRLYRRVLEEDPGRVSALYNLSILLEDLEEGLELLRRASDLAPEDREVLERLVTLLAREERPEEAVVYLERLRRQLTEDRAGLEDVAERYEGLGYPQEAVETYEQLLELDPNEERYHFAQARLLLTSIGDERRGPAALESALEAGFSDEGAVGRLLAARDLVAPVQVEELLDRYGLLPDELPEPAPEETSYEDPLRGEIPRDGYYPGPQIE